MNYYFPLHLNGGNRGCEAIAKGSAIVLGEKKESLIGLSSNIELDIRLGLDKYVTMVPQKKWSYFQRLNMIIFKLLHHDFYVRRCKEYAITYNSFLDNISTKDVMISTGGDMMCYNDNQVIYTVDKIKDKGIKAILWGCSMGEENLTPRKFEALKKFDIIYARESLTEKFLLSKGLNNVICYPDPAFILDPQEVELPPFFSTNSVIGLNISKMILKNDSSLLEDLYLLIQYILDKTDCQILLVPHVLWKGQDDRLLSNMLFEKYMSSGRLHVLDSTRYNYCEIRYIISRCRFFIGARTHSIISAYSTCVPSLALGYSIKARGIAKDLGLDNILIVNSVEYKNGNLLKSFEYLMQNENIIRTHLLTIMPKYKNRLKEVKGVINYLLK